MHRLVKSLGWPGLAGVAALVLAVVAIVLGQRWDAQAAALQAPPLRMEQVWGGRAAA